MDKARLCPADLAKAHAMNFNCYYFTSKSQGNSAGARVWQNQASYFKVSHCPVVSRSSSCGLPAPAGLLVGHSCFLPAVPTQRLIRRKEKNQCILQSVLLFIVTVIVSTSPMDKGTQNSENSLLRSCKPCLPGNPAIFFLFKDMFKIYSVTISYMYIMYLDHIHSLVSLPHILQS